MERLRAWTVCRSCCSVFVSGECCRRCAGIPDPMPAQVEHAAPPANLRPRIRMYAIGFGLGVAAALLVVIAG